MLCLIHSVAPYLKGWNMFFIYIVKIYSFTKINHIILTLIILINYRNTKFIFIFNVWHSFESFISYWLILFTAFWVYFPFYCKHTYFICLLIAVSLLLLFDIISLFAVYFPFILFPINFIVHWWIVPNFLAIEFVVRISWFISATFVGIEYELSIILLKRFM